MKKINIYASLLAVADRIPEWNSEIQRVSPFIYGIHYDIGDAELVPTLMLDSVDISEIQSHFPIDVHLMVRRPSQYFDEILVNNLVTSVAFHLECSEDIHKTIQTIKNGDKKVGLAIFDTTPADHLDPYILEIDYVIVMTIKAGYSGTLFIPEMLQKISEIHRKYPDLTIIVDGGVNQNTLDLCIDAGSRGAVMSAALFGDDGVSWLGRVD